MSFIAFNRPFVVGTEFDYILQTIANMDLSGDGAITKKCHALFEKILEVPKVLLTTSCTHALEMTALLLDIQPGDEVIVPSYTFVSTINAFLLRGARPVFVDIRPDTLNLNEEKIESHITPRTKAIIPVHYAGVGCEMDAIMDISLRYNIPVIEDNAHGLFAKYKGNFLGKFGVMATQSFHETKNFTCGEGGALLINDAEYIERAEIIREKGTNRSRFYRGQVDKYTWVDVGSSYLPSGILAAFLYAQIEARDLIQEKRRKIWENYQENLQDWANNNQVRLPIVSAYCEQAYHMFYILLPSLEHRQALITHLKSKNIQAVFHYVSLHLSPMGESFGYKQGDLPVTEKTSDCLLRLPFYNNLTESDQARVIEAICEFKI